MSEETITKINIQFAKLHIRNNPEQWHLIFDELSSLIRELKVKTKVFKKHEYKSLHSIRRQILVELHEYERLRLERNDINNTDPDILIDLKQRLDFLTNCLLTSSYTE